AYSTSLAVGVWVGYDDDRSLHLTGASAALPIVAQFLAEGTRDEDWSPFNMPAGITEGQAGSAAADGEWQSGCGSNELFLSGTEPPQTGCGPFESPDVERLRDWGTSLESHARRLLQRFIARQLASLRHGR
ncbi:MAG: hypothetical protein ACRELE_06640, partial [Gemmatimonadales bacterium]